MTSYDIAINTTHAVPAQVHDPVRLAAVERTRLLDTGPDEAFDRLTRLAATLLGTPYAFVTLVDDTRSFRKSVVEVGAAEPTRRASRTSGRPATATNVAAAPDAAKSNADTGS